MRKLFFKVVCGCAAISFLCTGQPGQAWADDTTAPEKTTVESKDDAQKTSRVFSLGEIEVIDTAETSGNPTSTRVSSEEMRQFDTDNLAEAASMVPGVTMDHSGARNEDMIRVRGFDQKHVPIYLDGIPIYVPYDGYPDLSRFTTFDLSEVVVSKGFTSVLYGPNTMGGAVNMVSRRPVEELEGDAGIKGQEDGFSSYLNLGTNQGLWYLQAGASYLDSEGWSLPSSFDSTATENGGKRDNSYHTDSKYSLKLGLTPNETDEYSFTYIKQHGEKGTPLYTGKNPATTVRYWQWPYWDKESFYLNTKTVLGQQDDYYVKTRLYYDKFNNSLRSYDDATYTTQTRRYAFKSWYDDYTLGGSMELGTFAIESHALRAAFHYKRDHHEEHDDDAPRQHFDEDIYSIGLEDTYDLTEDLYFIGGVGFDYIRTVNAEDNINDEIVDFNKGKASAINPQLGIFYRVTEGGLAHASVAMKSRMPSIKDKFSYRMGRAIPNADLDPERSINYELGYKQQFNETGEVEATVFYYDISDFIIAKTVATNVTQNQNLSEVEQYGAELAVSGRLIDELYGGGTWTHLQYHNKTNEDKLVDTPMNKLFGYLRYIILPGLSIQADAEFESGRYISTDSDRKVGHHTVFGSKLEYEFNEHASINFGVENIFDTEYEIEDGYPEPGRTAFAGVNFKF